MLTGASASDAFWMPTPTAMLPKPWARSMTVLHNRALTLSLPQSSTKTRSIQRLGPRQRGIAAAEIIDRKIDVEGPQLFCDLVRQRQFGGDLLLRYVDDGARPLFELRTKRFHDLGNRDFGERAGRNVDGNPHVEAELGEAEAGFQAALQGLFRQRDQARLRRSGHECTRHEDAELRMPGAGEGLHDDKLLLEQIDSRLVP